MELLLALSIFQKSSFECDTFIFETLQQSTSGIASGFETLPLTQLNEGPATAFKIDASLAVVLLESQESEIFKKKKILSSNEEH